MPLPSNYQSGRRAVLARLPSVLILASHFAELGIAPRDTLAFRRELFRDAPCARVATEHGKGRRARAEEELVRNDIVDRAV